MDKRHIKITSSAEIIGYAGSGMGAPNQVPRSVAQRRSHGSGLATSFNSIPEETDFDLVEDDSPYKDPEPGIYIVVTSESGYPLSIEMLDVSGSRLCNVTESGLGETEALVFIPALKRHEFSEKLKRYSDQNPKERRKHNSLFDNVKSIRIAAIESFWTSSESLFPCGDDAAWWEMWLYRRSVEWKEVDQVSEYFRAIRAEVAGSVQRFETCSVILVKTTASQIAEAKRLISCLMELRAVTDTAHFFLQSSAYEQREWLEELQSRVRFDDLETTSVLVLDHGINYHHPALSDAISSEASFCWDPKWGHYSSDPDHGTMQAGLILYGDLADRMLDSDDIEINYSLESCRIINSGSQTEKYLYGALTDYSVATAEEQLGEKNRVISLAVTAEAEGLTGQPSAWSAEIDQLSHDGGGSRLFIISGGNIRGYGAELVDYRAETKKHPIEDPAQCWNGLTVGAYTEKVNVTEHLYRHWEAISKFGDLSPTSRTSIDWEWLKHAPLKPELVEEGGNRLVSPSGDEVTNSDCVSLVTTGDIKRGVLFRDHADTSAATALVSKLAAEVWAAYPDYMAQTVRALLVHSASWTEAMLDYIARAEKDGSSSGEAKELLLRRFGYGVPNRLKALSSANQYVTMVLEDSIKPYQVAKGGVSLNEMHLIKLPWPSEELEGLGSQEVCLTVTLSYFIEPNPGRRAYAGRFRYLSHGLRFRLIDTNEDLEDFKKRVNVAARDKGEKFSSDTSGWDLKPNLCTKGSLHQDRWRGSAVDLSRRMYISVYPVAGWWKQRKMAKSRANAHVDYSLVVSIDAGDTDVDIYSAVEQEINIESEVEAEAEIEIEIPF